MKFAIETETNGSLSSPYVKLFVETKSLLIAFLEKIKLVGTYANVISFVSLVQKLGLVHISLNYSLSSSFEFFKFHHEINRP